MNDSLNSLIPKSSFTGLESVAHLATGGESPMLRSHLASMQQFMLDKSLGEPGRELQAAVMESARQQCATLFKVPAQDLTFLSSATEGINVVCYGLDWQRGDNVVVADVEFPSDILPWTKLRDLGVEIRIVKHNQWIIDEQEILAQVDHRTKVVALSQVSMFTGQHMDIPLLSREIRSAGALFLLDATHAAGVVPVDASLADIMVSSCYKWLLGTHGTAVFYWNRERLSSLSPPFIGWASVASSGGWQSPLEFSLHESADRFLAANPSYVSLYILDNALKHILELGENTIHAHSLALGKILWQGLDAMGLEMMTPEPEHRRAGNTCYMVAEVEALRAALEKRGVLVWGAYGRFGRVRVSAHVQNDIEDVDRFLGAMEDWLKFNR
ncbi:hypothetical protein AB833_22130 [Chromatiales bacterium (ex Bugula neritina AB1)]|nr:hypothetical protein AB833_22130 [Chromatiales bacterium (ex Bugula neritina AB1)]